MYFLAGTQHGPARFPPTVSNGQQPDNPVDHGWVMRALLLAMQRWVNAGTAPPPSAYPMIKDGTLVKASAIAFPRFPASRRRRGCPPVRAWRIRCCPVAVAGRSAAASGARGGRGRQRARRDPAAGRGRPLATYTGWNFRNASIGASGDLVSLLGSAIPFPLSRAAREAAKDPRRSIEERYATRDAYNAKLEQAGDALVLKGYLIYDDLPRVLQRSTDTWDVLMDTKDARAAKAAQ